MPIFDHFGFFAPYYERVIRFDSAERLISLAGLPIAGALLDAGGGTGRVTQALSGYASSLVVADLSLGMLRQAASKNGLHAICSHTEILPFPDGSFERIIMIDALHHVCDQQETANELWRILKTDGRLVIEEPDIRTLSIKVVAIAEKLAMMRSNFISPPKIERLFPYENAQSRIVQDGYNAWIVIDKK